MKLQTLILIFFVVMLLSEGCQLKGRGGGGGRGGKGKGKATSSPASTRAGAVGPAARRVNSPLARRTRRYRVSASRPTQTVIATTKTTVRTAPGRITVISQVKNSTIPEIFDDDDDDDDDFRILADAVSRLNN